MPSCSTYLEVGVQYGATFGHVEVPFRWGVDPQPRFDLADLPEGARFSSQTSDAFFSRLQEQHRFDLVFLDGLHEWRQTYRDMIHTLAHTSPHAIILVDDIVPDDEWSALPDQGHALRLKQSVGKLDTRWQGDVFKVMLALLKFHPELDFRTIMSTATDDNAQAVVWRREPPKRQSDSAVYRTDGMPEIDAADYSDVFVRGQIPEDFKPTSEEAAIEAALAGSRAALGRGWDPWG